jgi:hypothetical protein
MRRTCLSLGAALGLSALLIGGAAALQLIERGRPPATGELARLIASDWVHVPAHLLLYGALALCCARAFGGRRWAAALVVGAVALAQEGCQSLLFGRAPGWPEAFDLCIDALALALVLGSYRTGAARGTRRAERPKGAASAGVCYNKGESHAQKRSLACRPPPTPSQSKARPPPARG